MSDVRKSYIKSGFDFRYEHVFEPGTSEAGRSKQKDELMEILENSGAIYTMQEFDDELHIGFVSQASHDAFWLTVRDKLHLDIGSKYTTNFEGLGAHDEAIQKSFEIMATAMLQASNVDFKIISEKGQTTFEFTNMEDRVAFSNLSDSGYFEDLIDHEGRIAPLQGQSNGRLKLAALTV